MPTPIVIVIRQEGRTVAEHHRCYGRGETVYDPWHYVPVLARKPGAWRNGAPFVGLGICRRRSIACGASSPAPTPATGRWSKSSPRCSPDGLPAVEAACVQALAEGVHSAHVVISILARQRCTGPSGDNPDA